MITVIIREPGSIAKTSSMEIRKGFRGNAGWRTGRYAIPLEGLLQWWDCWAGRENIPLWRWIFFFFKSSLSLVVHENFFSFDDIFHKWAQSRKNWIEDRKIVAKLHSQPNLLVDYEPYKQENIWTFAERYRGTDVSKFCGSLASKHLQSVEEPLRDAIIFEPGKPIPLPVVRYIWWIRKEYHPLLKFNKWFFIHKHTQTRVYLALWSIEKRFKVNKKRGQVDSPI